MAMRIAAEHSFQTVSATSHPEKRPLRSPFGAGERNRRLQPGGHPFLALPRAKAVSSLAKFFEAEAGREIFVVGR